MWLASLLSFLLCYLFVVPSSKHSPYADAEQLSNGASHGGAVVAFLGTDSVYLLFMMLGNSVVSLCCYQVDKACERTWKEIEDLEGMKYDHKTV